MDPLIAAIEERFGLEVAAARRMDGGDAALPVSRSRDQSAFSG